MNQYTLGHLGRFSVATRWHWMMAGFLSLAVVGYLLLWDLDSYPAITGWDEGMYLETAFNVAHSGEYATRDGDEFLRLMPVGGTGPTLIFPTALSLLVSGNSLMVARLVIVAFTIGALLAAFLLAREIRGTWAGLASVPLFITAGYQSYDTLWAGRQVLAELPALAFLLWGLLCWIRSWTGGRWWLVGAGLLVACAIVTKNQLILVCGPAFLLLAGADALYYRQLGWPQRIAPLVATAGGWGVWTIASIGIASSQDLERYMEAQRRLTEATFLHTGPDRWIENMRFLLASGQGLLALTVVGCLLLIHRRRTEADLRAVMLPIFAAVSLAAFIILHLPWARYVYPGLAISSLCVAVLLPEISHRLMDRTRLGANVSAFVLVALASAVVGVRLVDGLERVSSAPADEARLFARELDLQVGPDEQVFGWEWEVDFYSDRTHVHPPNVLFPALIDAAYGDYRDPILDEARVPADVDFLLIGPFAAETGVFADEVSALSLELVLNRGPYELYRLP